MAAVVMLAVMVDMVGQVAVVVMSQVQVRVMVEQVGHTGIGQVIVPVVVTTLTAGRQLIAFLIKNRR